MRPAADVWHLSKVSTVDNLKTRLKYNSFEMFMDDRTKFINCSKVCNTFAIMCVSMHICMCVLVCMHALLCDSQAFN